MSHPKVLVLLAAFNGGKWIREQLDSIVSQVGVTVHVVVNDDGSTDDTREIVSGYAATSLVTLLPSVTRSGSAAQNFFFMIRETPAGDFDFIALSDQDDVWHADKLARGAQALSAGNAVGHSSATAAVWSDNRQRTLTQVGKPTESDFLFEGAGQGCTFILRADFYERVRKFFRAHEELTRRIHYHDWAIYCLARAWNGLWHFDSQPSMRYRQHGANDTGARSSLAGVTKRIALIRDGWYVTQIRAMVEIAFTANPRNPVVAQWRTMLAESRRGIGARLRKTGFLARGGRRKRIDTAVLVFAALAGWI